MTFQGKTQMLQSSDRGATSVLSDPMLRSFVSSRERGNPLTSEQERELSEDEFVLLKAKGVVSNPSKNSRNDNGI